MGRFVGNPVNKAADTSGERIGVLGGTFDPPHLGHLTAAEEAREVLGLSQVLFVPSGCPPHKNPHAYLPASVRCAMTQIAVADNPAFAVSQIEVDRPGPSYTIDTLDRLQQEYSDATLYFITGADMFLDLPHWKDPELLLANYHFVAVTRPGWDLAPVLGQMENFYGKYREHVHIVTIPGVAISATEIRCRIQAGRSIRYLVPGGVARFIEEKGLYRQV